MGATLIVTAIASVWAASCLVAAAFYAKQLHARRRSAPPEWAHRVTAVIGVAHFVTGAVAAAVAVTVLWFVPSSIDFSCQMMDGTTQSDCSVLPGALTLGIAITSSFSAVFIPTTAPRGFHHTMSGSLGWMAFIYAVFLVVFTGSMLVIVWVIALMLMNIGHLEMVAVKWVEDEPQKIEHACCNACATTF